MIERTREASERKLKTEVQKRLSGRSRWREEPGGELEQETGGDPGPSKEDGPGGVEGGRKEEWLTTSSVLTRGDAVAESGARGGDIAPQSQRNTKASEEMEEMVAQQTDVEIRKAHQNQSDRGQNWRLTAFGSSPLDVLD